MNMLIHYALDPPLVLAEKVNNSAINYLLKFKNLKKMRNQENTTWSGNINVETAKKQGQDSMPYSTSQVFLRKVIIECAKNHPIKLYPVTNFKSNNSDVEGLECYSPDLGKKLRISYRELGQSFRAKTTGDNILEQSGEGSLLDSKIPPVIVIESFDYQTRKDTNGNDQRKFALRDMVGFTNWKSFLKDNRIASKDDENQIDDFDAFNEIVSKMQPKGTAYSDNMSNEEVLKATCPLLKYSVSLEARSEA